MGLIREPLDVDFVVEPRMLTEMEKEKISAYIKKQAAKSTAKRLAVDHKHKLTKPNRTNLSV